MKNDWQIQLQMYFNMMSPRILSTVILNCAICVLENGEQIQSVPEKFHKVQMVLYLDRDMYELISMQLTGRGVKGYLRYISIVT